MFLLFVAENSSMTAIYVKNLNGMFHHNITFSILLDNTNLANCTKCITMPFYENVGPLLPYGYLFKSV